MSKPARCQAKNPSICRMHGNPPPKTVLAKMGKALRGGGNEKTQEKYVQDATEFYTVAEFQKYAEIHNVAINSDGYQEEFETYKNYLFERGINHIELRDSKLSVYPDNIDLVAEPFIQNLIQEYPKSKFSFENMAQSGRNNNMKGDVLIRIIDETGSEKTVSVSLKNYKGGISNIQASASTYQGFVMGFLFDGKGVGHWESEDDSTFNNRDIGKRNSILKSNNYDNFIPLMEKLDNINTRIRKKYIEGETYRYHTKETQVAFSQDAKKAGHEARPLIVEGLKTLPNEKLRDRVLKMTGFNGNEEMLMVGQGKMFSTIGNDKYKKLVKNLKTSEVIFDEYNQGILFTFINPSTKEELMSANIPLTINKNGAWHNTVDKYEGKKLHAKEGVELAWGERRPKKSREMATSTNCYINLNKIGLLDKIA